MREVMISIIVCSSSTPSLCLYSSLSVDMIANTSAYHNPNPECFDQSPKPHCRIKILTHSSFIAPTRCSVLLAFSALCDVSTQDHLLTLAAPRFNGQISLRVDEVVATLAQFFGPFVELDGPHVDVMGIRGQDPRHEGRPRRLVWIDDVVRLGAASLAIVVDDALGRCGCARGDEDFDEDLG